MFTQRIGLALAAALTLSLSAACLQGDAQEVRKQIKVNSADVMAARNVTKTGFHATAGRLPGAAAQIARTNLAGAKSGEAMADALKGTPAMAAILNAGPTLAEGVNAMPEDSDHDSHRIDYYPGDVQYGGGPVMKTTTHHALYINNPGTIADNWGDPEGFLSDLNESRFVHLLDQYVGSRANDRYPVGGNASVTYSLTGNTLEEPDVWAILHAAATVYGSGTQHLYHLFLPPGMDTCLSVSDPGACYSPDNPSTWVFCGYHAAVLFSDIGIVVYTMEPEQNVTGCQEGAPNPNGVVADSTNGTLVHEVFETISDPLGNAWNNIKMDVLLGDEIGDECELYLNPAHSFPDPSFYINGKLYQAQLEYSNDGHICTHEVH